MLCFSMICVSAGSKSNLGKAAGAEVAVLQQEAHFEVKMYKTLHARTTF